MRKKEDGICHLHSIVWFGFVLYIVYLGFGFFGWGGLVVDVNRFVSLFCNLLTIQLLVGSFSISLLRHQRKLRLL